MKDVERKLISRIRDAFAGVKLGDGVSLNMTEYLDSYESEPEFLVKAKSDERDNWALISDKTLEEFTCTFSFTDAAGFKFYLPAYMIWTLKNHEINNSVIGDFTIYALDIQYYVFRNMVVSNIFTADQLSCINDFLLYCIEHDDTCDGSVAKENLKKLKEEMTN